MQYSMQPLSVRDHHNDLHVDDADVHQQDNLCDHHEELVRDRSWGRVRGLGRVLYTDVQEYKKMDYLLKPLYCAHQRDLRVDDADVHHGDNLCDHRA